MEQKPIIGIIHGYNHEGMGVLHNEAQVIFVPGALRDERVMARLSGERKRKAAWGEALEILNSSPHRRPPPCPHYGRCGGCQLQHASYSHQLDIKREILARAMAPLQKYDPDILTKILPTTAAPSPTGYRNKGLFAVELPEEGQSVAIGFYGRRSRKVVGHGCPVLFSKQVNSLLDDLALWFTQNRSVNKLGDVTRNEHDNWLRGVSGGMTGDVSDKVSGSQKSIRHILIRESKFTGKIVMVLIGVGDGRRKGDGDDEQPPSWISSFLDAFAGVQTPIREQKYCLSGIGWLATLSGNGQVVDKNTIPLWGSLVTVEQCTINKTEKISFHFAISPESFYQVNSQQTNTLYDEVLNACNLSGGEIVWDLYCGAGTISICLANRACAVLGVDVCESAIRDAWTNARINSSAISNHSSSAISHRSCNAILDCASNATSGRASNATSDLSSNVFSHPLTNRLCFVAGAVEYLAPSLIGSSGNSNFLHEILTRQADLNTADDGQEFSPPKALVTQLSENSPDIIVLDPSSKGAKPAVLQTILAVRPQKIVYVSCNPATLSRDLLILTGAGLYTIQSIKPVDMFPQTAHLETIVELHRCDT
ncbi:MAG: hypothetical protein FWH52_00565 [Synergistaceae bacterium]|nr:hypothetical protein [Synergistaceae bacterium]